MITPSSLNKKFNKVIITSFPLPVRKAITSLGDGSSEPLTGKGFSYKQVGKQLFEVKGTEVYRVDTDCGTCTCKGWYYCNKEPKTCKHLEYLKDIRRVNE